MKDRVFYTDINLFGKDELKFYMECGSSYYVGNIVDLKYSSEDKKEEAENQIKRIIDFAEDRYVSGDRELTLDRLYHKTDDGILITYGDDIFCKKRKTCRPFINPLSASLDKLRKKNELSEDELNKISLKASQYSCHTIVLGYFNPDSLLDIEYNSIRIIILPKGRTCINI